MFRVQKKLIEILNPIMDIGLTGSAFILSYFIKKYCLPISLRGLSIAPNYYIVLLMIIIIWHLVFSYYGWIVPDSKKTLIKAIINVVKGVSIGMGIIILSMYFLKVADVSRIMMGIFFLLNIGLLSLCKFGLYFLIKRTVKNGKDARNIVIVGSKQRARDVLDKIRVDIFSNYKVKGCLEIDKSSNGQIVQDGIKVIGSISDLKNILLEKVVDEIIFAMPLKLIDNSGEYIALAENIGVEVRIIPDWQIQKIQYMPKIATARFEKLVDMPTLLLTTLTPKKSEFLSKVVFDYLFAGVALVLLSPVFAVVALAIKMSSNGPVFFKQERCGLNMRKFKMYKFRTMVEDAEEKLEELKTLNEADGPAFKIEKDPRIVPVIGPLLRKTQLDELPQLINIIKGEMSLIGPRPPIPKEVEKYDIWQRRRLSMKPGLTCYWQIAPNRNNIGFEDWMRMDLDYIDHWSFERDLEIFLKTFKVVLLGNGR